MKKNLFHLHKMDSGFVKIYRKISEWEWYQDSEMVHLLIHFIMKANHEPKYWQGITIEKGCFVTGLHSLSSETGISLRALRTRLDRMENKEISTIKTTNKFRLIRLNNYSSYQFNEKKNDKQNDKPTTIKRQSNDNKQELKELEELKNKRREDIDGALSVKVPPDKNETYLYFREIGLSKEDAKNQTIQFHDHHDARGWVLSNRKKMVDWKASVRTWKRNMPVFTQHNGKINGNGKGFGQVNSEPTKADHAALNIAFTYGLMGNTGNGTADTPIAVKYPDIQREVL
ncbi:MAG: hypothetical protein HGA87_03265 [Desulfobulbaceae bacterium]|nr:hypothetical protein [Desulfobulbaceae bacterium]